MNSKENIIILPSSEWLIPITNQQAMNIVYYGLKRAINHLDKYLADLPEETK